MTWLVFVAALATYRPKGINWQTAKALVPDVLRLLRTLATDPSTSRSVRLRLGLLLIYLASPFDLVPDFIPVLGYADDIIAVSLVLRSIIRQTGADTLTTHWTGTPEGLDLVRRLAGISGP